MKTNIFIPEKIKVGFQERKDTYTKKLAYVIYYDQKGVLRKEASWKTWRDEKIQDVDFLNVPTSGLVLNKKVGGYSSGWDHRQTYVRVYDPRDFEFEITVTNLLYILENTSSIKGKGLDGEFVYAWDGKDLVLIPTDSPDYIEMTNFNKIIHEKNHIKAKDLIIGATYRAKDNTEWIYMGRFDCHTTKSERVNSSGSVNYIYHNVNKGKHHFFLREVKYDANEKIYLNMLTLKSIGEKFIGTVSLECVENYAELFGQLEHKTEYSPYDESKDEYVVYDFDKFTEKIIENHWATSFYTNTIPSLVKIKLSSNQNGRTKDSIYEVFTETRDGYYSHWNRENIHFKGSLKEIHDQYQPSYKNKYLTNGNLHQKGE